MSTFLGMDVPELISNMRNEVFDLQKKINKTPKWRKIKRYRLLEKLYKLEEDLGLIEHVLCEDQG